MRWRVPTLALLIAGLAGAPAAHAGSFGNGFFGTEFIDDAGGGGQTNTLTMYVGSSDGKMHLIDTAASITPGVDCANEAPSAHYAYCTIEASPYLLLRLEGGNDSFSTDSFFPIHADGGAGNDTITGGQGDDVLTGDSGNDTVSGGIGNDTINDGSTDVPPVVAVGGGNDTESGGADNDTIVAGPGADTIDGGAGIDTLDYSARSTPTHVTVDAGTTDDGAAGELDDVKNIDVLLGGSGADTFVAGGGSSKLYGNKGDDVLTGGAGNDLLDGGDDPGSGNDTLDGAGGADELRGGDGTDTATYASRSNAVTVSPDDIADDGEAGEGDNVRSDVENLIGGSGADTFKLRDGRAESVTCGPGADSVVADAVDTVAADCESVDRPATTGGGGGSGGGGSGGGTGGGGSAGPTVSALLVSTGTVKADRHRRVAIKLACSAGGGCGGRLVVRAAGKVIGHPSYLLAAGKQGSARVVLPAKLARRGGRLLVAGSAVIGTAPATPTTVKVAKHS